MLTRLVVCHSTHLNFMIMSRTSYGDKTGEEVSPLEIPARFLERSVVKSSWWTPSPAHDGNTNESRNEGHHEFFGKNWW